MKQLKEVIVAPHKRTVVVDDCVRLIDDEVARKSGLTGLAIKGAYGVVKAIKKGIIRDSVDHLLDGFIGQLEPFYTRYRQAGASEPFSALLMREKEAAAEALLALTDDRARGAANATMKKAYEKLRPTAREHVLAAVPGIARLLDQHVQRPS